MTKKTTINTNFINQIKAAKPFVIAGPCSAETETQVLNTALHLKKTGRVDLFRAGIWKPRTSPGNFEGIGDEGLLWLQKIRKQTGLPFTVEIATTKHIERALDCNTNVLWIGSRTTTNPFLIQEIAESLRGVDIPVLVKNPINPDLKLWMGAIQRLQNVGIQQIAAIHRGFSQYGVHQFRNLPIWEIPMELKRLMPEIPLICDPSHICGRRDLLPRVIQKAGELNFDGLMIEAHENPENAWTDGKQQIKPEMLSELVESFVLNAQKPEA